MDHMAQVSCIRTWWQMWELVARGRAFPLRLIEKLELRSARGGGDGSKVSQKDGEDVREDWEDLDDLDESNVERVVAAVASPKSAAASDETTTSATSDRNDAAALVVALPMECLARVFTFMGTGSDMKIISDIPRLSRHLVLPKDPKDNKKVLRCCKHLLSQGFCNHGQVVQVQRRATARPAVGSAHLSCWYCSRIFPYGQDGVQDDNAVGHQNSSELQSHFSRLES